MEMEANIPVLDKLIKGQKELTTRMTSVEAKLDEHDKRFDAVEARLNEHSKKLDSHTMLLEKLIVGQREIAASNEFIRNTMVDFEDRILKMMQAFTDWQDALERKSADHEHRIIALEDTKDKHTALLAGLRKAK